MCPHCGQNAPVVYRGVAAYCAACGHARVPLTGNPLHLAGQPSRFGSIVARVLGWIVLGVGLSFALGIAALAHLVFPTGVVGLAIGGPIAVLSLLLGVILLRGGKRLDASGASAEKSARAQALFALAAHKGGTLTALDASQALDIPVREADALLQTLAKEEYEKVAVDIDPTGTLVYRFAVSERGVSERGVSGRGVSEQAAGPIRVRIDPEVASSPNRAEWERLEAEEAGRKTDGEAGQSPARSTPENRARANR